MLSLVLAQDDGSSRAFQPRFTTLIGPMSITHNLSCEIHLFITERTEHVSIMNRPDATHELSA